MQSETTLADSERPPRSTNPWLASFSFTGRAGRLEFWTITIATSLLSSVLVISILPFPPLGRNESLVIGPSNGDMWTLAVFWILLFVPACAVFVKRLHDLDRTGLWVVLVIVGSILAQAVVSFHSSTTSTIPSNPFPVGGIIGLIVLLVVGIPSGSADKNRYGPSVTNRKRWLIIQLAIPLCVTSIAFVLLRSGPIEGLFQRLPLVAQRGGSLLALEINSREVIDEWLDLIMGDLKSALRDARSRGIVVKQNDGLSIRAPSEDIQALSTRLSKQLMGYLLHKGDVQVETVSDTITIKPTAAGTSARIRRVMEHSISVMGQRLPALGIWTPTVERPGDTRITITAIGYTDVSTMKTMLTRRGRLTFNLTHPTITPKDAATSAPRGYSLLSSMKKDGTLYLVENVSIVSGQDITTVEPGVDQRTNDPIISFRFNVNGARRFAQATQENVGRALAIVLDNEVISAPTIREPILGGSGQISGISSGDAKVITAQLRSGPLAASFNVLEERVLTPTEVAKMSIR